MISDIAPFFPYTPHTIADSSYIIAQCQVVPTRVSLSRSPAMQNSAWCMQRLHWDLYLKASVNMAGADVCVCMLCCFSHVWPGSSVLQRWSRDAFWIPFATYFTNQVWFFTVRTFFNCSSEKYLVHLCGLYSQEHPLEYTRIQPWGGHETAS